MATNKKKVSLAKIDPHNQKRTRFCTLYAITHALEVYKSTRYKKKYRINPKQIVVKAFRGIGFRVFNRGLGIMEAAEAIKGRRIQARADGKAKEFNVNYVSAVTYDVYTIKQLLGDGFPVIVVLKKAHAVCIVGYDENSSTFEVVDSQVGYRNMRYSDFDDNEECYIVN